MIQERFAISTSHLVMYYDTANGTNISHDPQHDCTARGSASCVKLKMNTKDLDCEYELIKGIRIFKCYWSLQTLRFFLSKKP